MKILVTAFEPFGGRDVNASLGMLDLLKKPEEATLLQKHILPVNHKTAPAVLQQLLADIQPDAVVCMGEAGGIDWIQLERLAVNWMDFRIPDNSGVTMTDEKIIPDGESAYFSTLPLRQFEQVMLDNDLPVKISMSAGTYLCNQIFYTLMHWVNENQLNIPAGFIHLPAEMVGDEDNECALNCDLETGRIGIQSALALLSTQRSVSA